MKTVCSFWHFQSKKYSDADNKVSSIRLLLFSSSRFDRWWESPIILMLPDQKSDWYASDGFTEKERGQLTLTDTEWVSLRTRSHPFSGRIHWNFVVLDITFFIEERRAEIFKVNSSHSTLALVDTMNYSGDKSVNVWWMTLICSQEVGRIWAILILSSNCKGILASSFSTRPASDALFRMKALFNKNLIHPTYYKNGMYISKIILKWLGKR